ncbi:MAG: hypothetical protein ACOC2W_01200 [bacterium]
MKKNYLVVCIIMFVFMFMGAYPVFAVNDNNEMNNNGNSAGANAGSTAITAPTFEASDGKRNTPNAVLPNFPQGPSYFSDVPMTHEFLSLADLAKINFEWTDASVKSWMNEDDKSKVDINERIIYGFYDPSEKFKITFENTNKRKRSEFIGVLVASANDSVSMEAVFAKLADKCIEHGANLMYPMNEGAQRVLTANSKGWALGYSHIVFSGGSERTAGAGTIGYGNSEGESKYNHEPFARVAIYRVKPEIYKNVKTFPENGYDKVKQENKQLREYVRNLQEKIKQHQQQNEAQ